MSASPEAMANGACHSTDALDSVPVDGAAQHDHYLYGAPKRD